MSELIITGATIVTRDEVFQGSVLLQDGLIRHVDPVCCQLPWALDIEGNYLLPGLVETHTDNLEHYMMPRPAVTWPSPLTAVLSHDAQICGAGITTVLDSVFLGAHEPDSYRPHLIEDSISAIRRACELSLLRSDHLLHLRCELTDERLMSFFESHVHEPMLKLVSLNDHTPGQRQWRDMDTFLTYYQFKHLSSEKVAEIVDFRLELQQRHVANNRSQILRLCRDNNIPLASHDDTTEEHVLQAAEDGVTISEFPTTMEAAAKAAALGIKVVAGAPNLIRGQSHSANVSARDLAAQGFLDALSSDYYPAGLLEAAFLLHRELDYPLPEAVARVSDHPAEMVGLSDRGRIAPGQRADLIEVAIRDNVPVVKRVWRLGKKVI